MFEVCVYVLTQGTPSLDPGVFVYIFSHRLIPMSLDSKLDPHMLQTHIDAFPIQPPHVIVALNVVVF